MKTYKMRTLTETYEIQEASGEAWYSSRIQHADTDCTVKVLNTLMRRHKLRPGHIVRLGENERYLLLVEGWMELQTL